MSFPHVTKEMCEAAVAEHGSQLAAARALRMPGSTFTNRLNGHLPLEQTNQKSIPKAQARSASLKRRHTDDEIVDAYVACGGNMSEANIMLGYTRKSGAVPGRLQRINAYAPLQVKETVHLEVENGVVLIGSDAHIWPNLVTTGMVAFHHFAQRLQPKVIIANGDIIDGADASDYPDVFGYKPTLQDEIAAAQEFLRELRHAAPGAKTIWPIGNHDERFEKHLKRHASQYEGVFGTQLKDHFPDWTPCISSWINYGAGQSPVYVLHSYRNGQNATYNNTLHAGVHTVTGHLHNGQATPFNDLWGTRWGMDSGMLACPDGPQFRYRRGRPVNWRSCFLALTFKTSKLLPPEFVFVIDEAAGLVEFRGELIHV